MILVPNYDPATQSSQLYIPPFATPIVTWEDSSKSVSHSFSLCPPTYFSTIAAREPSQVPTAPSRGLVVDSIDVPISEAILDEAAASVAIIALPRPQDIECPKYADWFYVITRGLAVGIFFSW